MSVAAAAASAGPPSGCRARLGRALTADLGFHGAPSNGRTHAWHPFPAKFPPQLPRFFIEALTSPGDTVLDPMCGSGTTLVEAVDSGRRAIGCDIDPLARLIAAVKLTPVDASEVIRTGVEVLLAARRRVQNESSVLKRRLRARFDAKTRQFVDYWFLPAQQLELLALVEEIEDLPDEQSRSFFQLVLSSTIIAKSGGVSRARDLAHTRPHRVESKTPKSAFSEFEQRLARISRDAEVAGSLPAAERPAPRAPRARPAESTIAGPSSPPSFEQRLARIARDAEVAGSLPAAERPAPRAPRARPAESTIAGPSSPPSFEVRAARAERTGLESGSVDLVVTSPPYANGAIDYMRAHKFSLVWLGLELDALTSLRREYLGHDARASTSRGELPEHCEAILGRLFALDRRKAGVLRRYFGEMEDVFRETHRVVRQDGAVVVVVGTSVLRGIDVETPFCLAALAQRVGFDLSGIAVRRLDRDRRMMPARWNRAPESGIEHRMHEEHVIGLVGA